ncbi:MAG: hypothetical protein ACTHQ3_21275 [Motilibacteraceae bacterium]
MAAREDAVPRTGTGRPPYDAARPGDRLVTVGAVLFGIGLVAVLITVVPFFLGTDRMPLGVYLTAALAPIGFAVALVGLVRGARSRRPAPGARTAVGPVGRENARR